MRDRSLFRTWAIALLGKDNGYDLIDAAISGHFGICMVLVNADSENAWRKELGIEDQGELKPPIPKGGDVEHNPPFKLEDYDNKTRTTLRFQFVVNHDNVQLYTKPVDEILMLKGNVLVTIDLTECVSLTGDWSRWINTIAERYPKTEVLLGDNRHHREAFEARNLTHVLSRIT